MSGRCYACGDEFSRFFSGEKGCKNCGFEFCKKCIAKKIAVPKLKNEKHHVCDKCYKLISKGEKAPKALPPSPPKVFQQRLENLDKKDKTGSGRPSSSTKARDKYAGMDPVDADLMRRHEKLKEGMKKNAPLPDAKEIETRLSALKADRPAPPTEAEMRERLAKLQGKALQSQSQQPQRFAPDKRTNEEQIVDLMDELFDEHVIDQRQQGLEPDNRKPTTASDQKTDANMLKESDANELKEIHALIEKSAKELQLDAENALLSLQQDERLMSKLKELKKKPGNGEDKTDSVDTHTMDDGNSDEAEDDDDAVASKLIKQYLAEAKLDEDTAKAISESKMSMKTTDDAPTGSIPDVYKPKTEEDDELPWCCICNDDAKMKCLDCDGDLFCAQCYGQAHKESYMKDHDFERYPKRKR